MDSTTTKIKFMQEDDLKTEREFVREVEAYQVYSGEDKVISSDDALRELSTTQNHTGLKLFTKIPKLDSLIGGFREGQLIILSAPSGHGKTMFLQDLTRKFQEQDVNSLWFSFEVGHEEFFERFGEAIPLFYLPRKTKESSTEWLYKRVLEGIGKFNTKVVFIDHLHFLLDMKILSQTKNVSLAIGMLMRELKKIAIKTNAIIFLVAHMKKTKLDEVPTEEDLRDSSFVAQESDVVMMMWRRREADRNSPTGFRDLNENVISVAKNRRTGAKGAVKLAFNRGHFTEITENDYGLQEI